MIDGLQEVVLATATPEPVAADYAALFGTAPETQSGDIRFRLANMDFVLVPVDGGAEGLREAVFTAPDLDRARRLLPRRGLPIIADDATRITIDPAAANGVRLILADRQAAAMPPHAAPDAIGGLDHVVIRSPDPQRALAVYGARLGLDLRLDQTYADWGARLLLFRCGDLKVEVAHSLKAGIGEGPDELWGFSWRTADAAAARERIAAAGFDVSELRRGRRPGSRVFTVRNRTGGVPTLVIDHAGD